MGKHYLNEIKDICADPNKSSLDAYQIIVDIGIQSFVRTSESKHRMCQIIQRYLDIIREERIL